MEEKLRKMDYSKLLELYFANFTNDTRIPELLELLGQEKATDWIISQFTSYFRPVEISNLIYESSSLI